MSQQNVEKPDILTKRPTIENETKGNKTKRHIKEKKDLELYVKQKKIQNKILNQWLRELHDLQEKEFEQKEEIQMQKMLEDIKSTNITNQERSQGTIKQFNRQLLLDKAMEHYRLTEMSTSGETELKTINKKLASKMLKMHSIQADGNCMYTAIEQQMKLPNQSLRKQLIQYIRSNQNKYIEVIKQLHSDLDTYLVELETEWGDELELYIISEMLKIKIIVYNAFMQEIIHGESYEQSINLVFCQFQIAHLPHYNIAIQINSE